MRSIRAGTSELTVLQSLSAPDGTTRYVDQIVGGAPDGVTMLFFSWKTALLGRYDVVHVHWPELMIRAPGTSKAMLRRLALLALLVRSTVLRIPIVRTLHNVSPHEEGSAAETRALRRLDRHTAAFIRLNPTTAGEFRAPVITVLHGHYRDRFASFPLPASEPGRVLYFGLIRPYKGVETLLRVFTEVDDPRLALRVVGRPSGGLGRMVEAAEAADSRISARLEFVSDEHLVAEVGRAALVVLPYKEMHNSGVILVALSLDRPVLVPRTPSNEALAEEVRGSWVQLYDGELTAAILESALESAPDARVDERPHLEGRDWSSLGEQSHRVYTDAIARTRPTRRRS